MSCFHHLSKPRTMEMTKVGNRRLRLVLVPCPFQGHINPMLQLGTILHSRGFLITIAHTKFNFPKPSNDPDFHFISMSHGLSDNCIIDSMNFIEAISGFNTYCKLPMQESLLQMAANQEEHGEIAYIIYDGLMYFAEEVAKQLKIPSIMLRTSSAINAITYNAIPQLLKNGQIPFQDCSLLEPIPDLFPLRFKDLPIHNFERVEDLLRLITKGSETRSSSAIIWNTTDFLERTSLKQLQQHYKVPFFPIGPFHKMATSSPTTSFLEEDYNCMSWLDNQQNNSVIYVSLGSIASLKGEELAEMAWGLATSNQPFLWVIKPKTTYGLECEKLLPEGFEEAVGERGCIVKWAPQKQVLAHRALGGFWSHCGWNSTIESICEGVPMICQACFGDQRVHARYLSKVWGVGIEWEDDMKRENIERAVRRLMVDEEGKEVRQRALDLKKQFELCTGKGGSSCSSLDLLVDYIASS